ncbi:MAG: ribbon-helix-helix domain-containing protein [Solirubrobacteraceae bacterium]
MTVQVAVKLPEGLAGELDKLVQSGDFESRSQALRAGLETIIVEREREQLRVRYRDAMTRHPETPQEMAEATLLAREAIDEEPWERWW